MREWSVSTTQLVGEEGRVRALHGVRTDSAGMAGTPNDFRLEVDLVLLAMGFTGPVREGLLTELGVSFTARGAVATDRDHMTSVDGVFAAGDMRRGASLIVWAIREGRDAATSIDRYLASRGSQRARDEGSIAVAAGG